MRPPLVEALEDLLANPRAVVARRESEAQKRHTRDLEHGAEETAPFPALR